VESSRLVGGRLLRRGYTTGSCAAAAAGAAAWMLLNQAARDRYPLVTPKGIELRLKVENPQFSVDKASCAVRKDESDDPDVTKGIAVYAELTRRESGVFIEGGKGVGRVTRPGLDQPVGNAAINSTPRMMIQKECEAVARESGYTGGFSVLVSIPQGEELASRTFNPKAGIIGGISVLGTTGIVEPMSEAAYADSLRVEMHQLFAVGKRELLITVGNFAEAFARDHLLLSMESQVKCSNFIGAAFSSAVETGFKKALLIGHIGKLVKLGIGIFNTHSSHGDGRMETLISCALSAGGELPLLRAIADCVSTDAALDRLREAGLLDKTMGILGQRIEENLNRYAGSSIEAAFVCFAKTSSKPAASTEKQGEVAAQSSNAAHVMEGFRL
jgi:cobalt-precorrin-5B (C1)-methyltransferase